MIVKKPWGFEFEVLSEANCHIWCVVIYPGHSTSLHMHKKKKASLISLQGNIHVSFLNNSTVLEPYQKVIIRPGLFHRLSVNNHDYHPSILFEVENSNDRNDIVRLRDDYGRESAKYEWHYDLPSSLSQVGLYSDEKGMLSLHGKPACSIIEVTHPSQLSSINNYAIVTGGLSDVCGTMVAESGDVISGKTILELTTRFNLVRSSLLQFLPL